MKKSYEPKKRKPIDEITTKKKYSGEASPYWDFIKGRQRQSEGNPVEESIANPDVLAETDSLYNRPLTEVGNIQLEAIQEALPKLSQRQQDVLKLRGFEGYTEEETAMHLEISRLAVRNHLQRARNTINKIYRRKLLLEQK